MNINILTPTQVDCMTKMTRDGERNMRNRKPYRPKALKDDARKKAKKMPTGEYRSSVPVLYHA